jgi:DnaJ-class molecular chaperone
MMGYITPRPVKKYADERSRLYHPDRAPGNEAAFIHVREAYEVLTDPVKRYAYDR